jgi:hypothetical protein
LQAAFLDQEVIKIALTSPSGAGLQRFPMAHAAAMMFDAESSLCLTLESEAVAAGATDGPILVAAAVHILSTVDQSSGKRSTSCLNSTYPHAFRDRKHAPSRFRHLESHKARVIGQNCIWLEISQDARVLMFCKRVSFVKHPAKQLRVLATRHLRNHSTCSPLSCLCVYAAVTGHWQWQGQP